MMLLNKTLFIEVIHNIENPSISLQRDILDMYTFYDRTLTLYLHSVNLFRLLSNNNAFGTHISLNELLCTFDNIEYSKVEYIFNAINENSKQISEEELLLFLQKISEKDLENIMSCIIIKRPTPLIIEDDKLEEDSITIETTKCSKILLFIKKLFKKTKSL